MDNYYFALIVVAYITISFLARSNGTRVWSTTDDSSFNVLDYGAIGDGKKDDTEAFSKAWAKVCGAAEYKPSLLVPGHKTFLLKPISFKGPCKSKLIHFQINGSLVAPDSLDAWGSACPSAWISFEGVDNLVLYGQGKLDGRGSIWWGKVGDGCKSRPAALSIRRCNGLRLMGLKHRDSPNAHIRISGCDNSIISNLHINAPADSPNTDGIDISSSTHVQIRNSVIATGDDCIAIGSPASWINITRITCGPGHGISVGSLGRGGDKAQVEEIHVRNCTFKNSTNGARIKTWQGGSGYARKITFDDIPLIDVENPIIIDQYYCDRRKGGKECEVQPNAVAISDVTYNGFQGTSATLAAITLNCSQARPCANVVLQNVKITSAGGNRLKSVCENVKGSQKEVAPSVPCFQ